MKQVSRRLSIEEIKSPPVRGCGLKQQNGQPLAWWARVTPRAGVWIETWHADVERSGSPGHPPCGGVD